MRERLEQLCCEESMREMEKRRLRRSPSVPVSTCRKAAEGTKPCTSSVIRCDPGVIEPPRSPPRSPPPHEGRCAGRGAAMAALRAALLAPLLALSRAGPGPAPSARIEVELEGPGAGNGAGEAAGPGGSYTLRGALLGGPREEAIGGRLLLVSGVWGSFGVAVGGRQGCGGSREREHAARTPPEPPRACPGAPGAGP